MSTTSHLAIDLGAESGRAILGTMTRGRLELHEVHRFSHQPVTRSTGLHWDFDGLVREVEHGIQRGVEVCQRRGSPLQSVGVDTWGVDYGLISESGALLGMPHAYRDARHQVAFESLRDRIDFDTVFDRTGIAPMNLNTSVQLVAQQMADPDLLARAHRLLFMPDLIHGVLTRRSNESPVERSIASTSQLLDPRTADWAFDVVESLGLPTHLFGPIEGEAADRGALHGDLSRSLGVDETLRVVTPSGHDTACAVAAVPAEPGSSWCYLSSGTWSLLGAELQSPCVSEAARAASFTNELGIQGSVRFHKNIVGLWLLQECRREWAGGGATFDYSELVAEAERVASHRILLDPGHPPFSQPGAMIEKIAHYCESTGQPVPSDPGSIVRACLESLALEYRRTHEQLSSILDRSFPRIHLVGGGAKNQLLAQMTADATGAEVVVGPYEATAIGNVMTQALASGVVSSREEIRGVVARSFEPVVFEPRNAESWDRAYTRYLDLVGN